MNPDLVERVAKAIAQADADYPTTGSAQIVTFDEGFWGFVAQAALSIAIPAVIEIVITLTEGVVEGDKHLRDLAAADGDREGVIIHGSNASTVQLLGAHIVSAIRSLGTT